VSAAGDRESAGRAGEVGDRPDAARQGGWFSRVGNAVLDDETLTAHQKSIYAALCRFADRDGRCHPSLATIAAKAGCARRSVVEGLRVLEERGYVVREPRKAGRCRISNLYRVYGNENENEYGNENKSRNDAPDVVRQVPHSGREVPHPVQVLPSGSAPPASRTRLSEPDPETRRGNQRERPRPGRGEETFASWVAGVVDRTLGAGVTRK
jgi:DNA-binding transcriptional MocR family regulator